MTPAAPRKVRSLDVRPLIQAGEEPRAKILAMLAGLGPNESLALITPFMPSPLIERMQADGFHVRPERCSDGSLHTFFWRD